MLTLTPMLLVEVIVYELHKWHLLFWQLHDRELELTEFYFLCVDPFFAAYLCFSEEADKVKLMSGTHSRCLVHWECTPTKNGHV